MNYSQSFEEFSKGLSNTDLIVYGGAALILFALLREKLGPVKDYLVSIYNQVKSKVNSNTSLTNSSVINSVTFSNSKNKDNDNDGDFLKLIASWKNTRNLAESSNCKEAVKILDNAFPHLAPHECVKEGTKI